MARILITAGPTYEPIDAVRFIGNRSSGKVGAAIADRASELGWEVWLLLGPNAAMPQDPAIDVTRFESTDDLQTALDKHLAWCDCLVMAAAVADFRPRSDEIDRNSKRRRTGEALDLSLEPTPDLLARCAQSARADQLLVGFALEPAETLIESAKAKLAKKNIDLIVANPLETMDAGSIDARLIGNPDRGITLNTQTDGKVTKAAFADWLLAHIDPLVQHKTQSTTPNPESTTHVEL